MISKYNQLCPVVFGAGAVSQLADIVKELSGTKALCIFDSGVKAAGISDGITNALGKAGIAVVIFDEVLPDAPDKMVDRVGKLAQDEKVDIVIGIGGGSSLDTAKAASVLVENPLPIKQYFVGKGARLRQRYRLF